MRFFAPAFALSLVLATVSSVSFGKKSADVDLDPMSVSLTDMANADIAANKLEAATDILETALAVDPRNRPAYLALARIAQKQELPGKAIRFYREALLLEPNDLGALAGQGEAMVQKGALTKAKENLARLERLCIGTCVEQLRLAAAIEKGTKAPPVLSAEAVAPEPIVTDSIKKP